MKNKKENAFKKKIKELRKTSRGKAILKLIGWIIFFLALFLALGILSLISSNKRRSVNNPTIPVTEKETTKEPEKPEEILSIETLNRVKSIKEYDYNYEIKIGEEKYIYNGHKTSTEDTGYKESGAGIIKYTIDRTGVYSVTTSGKVLINNLYENINSDFLNLENVINILKSIELKINYNHNCLNYLYEGSKDNIEYKIEFHHETKKLLFINIISESESYYLNFSNIGE